MLERVQRRATKLIPSLKDLTYTERLVALKLPSLQHRRRRGDMIQTYKIISEADRINKEKLFPSGNEPPTRGHSKKVYKQRSRLEVRQTFFSQRVVNDWNKLPEYVIQAEKPEQFKARLDTFWKGEQFKNPFS